MRSLHLLLTVLLAVMLILVTVTACGRGTDGDGTGSGDSEDDTDPAFTVPPIVPSPSLDSLEMIEEIGVQAGDVILAAEQSRGDGAIYDGLNKMGKRLWKASNAEIWAVEPNRAIPEGFPTLRVSEGTEVTAVNHTAYEIVSDQYMSFLSGETYDASDLPAGAGVYIRIMTVEIPRPSVYDEDPELGAFFGEMNYFVVVAFE